MTTLDEFIRRLREKYAHLRAYSDEAIAQRVLTRHPEYQKQLAEPPSFIAEAGAHGVLSGDEIRQRILAKQLYIAPILDWGSAGNVDGQFGRGSLDVRLGTHFALPRATAFSVVDATGKLGESGERTSFETFVRAAYAKPFVLHPGQFALAYTLEYFKFPPDLMGYVIGRSSWGRLGLIIATATMVNPSFSGVITLELANVGNLPVVLYPGMRIAQIVIHNVDRFEYPATSAANADTNSKYIGQLPGNRQRLFKDIDIPWVVPRSTAELVGIVGPTKSGKSVVASHLSERGFRLYSMSGIVKQVATERGYNLRTPVLQDLGDELRQENGNDYLARRLGDIIRRDKSEPSRVLITGFKHPAEVDYFARDDRFRLVAIDATFETCKTLKEAESGALTTAQSEEFDKNWHRDYNAGTQYGQDVQGCIAKAGLLVINNNPYGPPATKTTQEQLKTLALKCVEYEIE